MPVHRCTNGVTKMKFQCNTCPLCNKILTFSIINKTNIFSCPVKANDEIKSHYSVVSNNKGMTQIMYIMPFAIYNFSNGEKSKIYKLYKDEWKLVAETNTIPPSGISSLKNKMENYE